MASHRKKDEGRAESRQFLHPPASFIAMQVPQATGGASTSRSLDKKAYQCIYPQYLDARLTPSEGRRLTKTQAVEHPSMDEIVIALRQLGYRNILVDPSLSLPCSQTTSGFPFVPRGCIRVAIKSPVDEHYIKKSEFDKQTRNAVVSGIESKQELLRRVAAIIKTREGRRVEVGTVAEVLAAYISSGSPKAKK